MGAGGLYPGVFWDEERGVWRGRVTRAGRKVDLGWFESRGEAEAAVRGVGGGSGSAMPRVGVFRLGRVQYGRPIGPLRACACGCGDPVREVVARWLPDHTGRLSPVDWLENGDGCWIWQRAVNGNGYGLTGRGLAHRVAYERARGAGSADGLQVHHECGEKRCVNPAHLSGLTPDEHGRVHGEMARELWRLRRAA